MKLDRFKQKALVKEFPFLNEFFEENDYEFLDIKKVDENFLKSTPREYHWDGSLVGISEGSKIHFIIRKDHQMSPRPVYCVIKDQVEPEYTSGSNYAHTDTWTRDGETIIAAIDRETEENAEFLNELEFIVEERFGIHTTDHESHGKGLVLWKAQKSAKTVGNLINKMVGAAIKEITAEGNF